MAWRAAPLFVAAAVAIAGAMHLLPAPPVSAPIRMFLVVAALLLGVGATFVFDRASARPYWQMVLVVVLVQMPVVALYSSALRAPFVALARGSAGPLLWLTFACLLVLAGLWIFAALQPGDAAGNAALLMLLPALIVPAVLGAGADLDESATLAMLGQASLLAGVAVLLALPGPLGWRPVIAVATFVAQVIGLWVMGRGPVIGPEAGWISYVSLATILLAALVSLVTAPLGTLFTRRFFQTVGEESGATKPASVPQRGARRRSDT
ncbi:MAG: hypothetical protein KC442_00150 [Thermomicrobiales bacterium]|nr:hypothetical protein [Thermomicrobiales bacterium]